MQLDDLDIYILKPKEATNLVTNPSFEIDATGYTAVSSSLGISATYQRRGRYSLAITPNTGVASGVYFGTVSLTSGTSYAFSADVLGIAGQTYRVQIRSTGGTVLAETSFTGVGYWQRKSVTYLETATNSRRLYIIRDAVASTAVFYTDGLLCEAGNESSYFDGDLKGYIRNQADYRWNGKPHTSTSWRSATTRHGGEYVKLSTIGTLLAIIGLGMSPINIADTQVMTGGSLYQKSTVDVRDFTLPMLIYGNKWSDVQASRKTLIDLIRPDASTITQPLTMVIQGKDPNGLENMERVVIPAVYKGGLDGNIENQNQEIVNLQFRQFFPLIQADGERTAQISYVNALTAALLMKRTKDGTWSTMTSTGNPIYRVIYNPVDNKIYVAGSFSVIGGVTAASIAVYDPVAGTFSAMGTGTAGIVTDLAVDAQGNVYAGGPFSSMGGAANSSGVARWNLSTQTWTGISSSAVGVNTLVIAGDGSLYAAGNFSSVNGVSADTVARYDGSTWASVGWASSGTYAFKLIAKGRYVYMLHNSSIDSYVSRYNGVSWAGIGYAAVISGAAPMAGAINAKGELVTFSPTRIATYNGTQWTDLGYTLNGNVNGAEADPVTGDIYAGGNFTSITGPGSFSLSLSAFILSGTSIKYLDVSLPAASYYTFAPANGELYVGGSFNATVYPGVVNTNSISTASTYPVFKITGPGSLWQIKNYTTGKEILFYGLSIAAYETVTISLQPGNIYAISSLRGNVFGNIIGSDLDFPVVTGSNNISIYMTGTNAGTLALMSYHDTFWSLDGATR